MSGCCDREIVGPLKQRQKDLERLAEGLEGKMKDSGLREQYPTGAQREPQGQGKGRYDLVSFAAIKRVARICELGAVKYGDNNWRKGLPLSRFIDSGIRHLVLHILGKRDEDHIAAAIWNLMGLLETEERIDSGELPEELKWK